MTYTGYFVLGLVVGLVGMIVAVRKSNKRTQEINERNRAEIDRLHGTMSTVTPRAKSKSTTTATRKVAQDDTVYVPFPSSTHVYDTTADNSFTGKGGDFGGGGASSSWSDSSPSSSSDSGSSGGGD